MDDRESSLVTAFVQLADTLVADYDVVELAQQLVEDCVRLLDASAAGLLVGDPRFGLQVLASTSEQTQLLELFQVQANTGPCLQAYRTGRQVLVEDLAKQSSWPDFTEHAVREGFQAVFAIPLRLRADRIGALNLFRTQPGMLSDADLRVAQALADVATIGILQQRILARSEVVNEQLQTALNSRIVIEQAKGVLAERGELDMDQAFTLLRKQSRRSNRRLVDVATAIVNGDIDTTKVLDH